MRVRQGERAGELLVAKFKCKRGRPLVAGLSPAAEDRKPTHGGHGLPD